MELYDDLDQDMSSPDKNAYDRIAASEKRVKRLEACNTELKVKSEQLKKRCTMLEKNLSCLFKTAWTNMHQKDAQISRLRQELKEFRRITGMVAPGVKPDGHLAQIESDQSKAEFMNPSHGSRQNNRPIVSRSETHHKPCIDGEKTAPHNHGGRSRSPSRRTRTPTHARTADPLGKRRIGSSYEASKYRERSASGREYSHRGEQHGSRRF